MPYITSARRADFCGPVRDAPRTAGELNFVLTREIVSYVRLAGLSYASINDVVGALEGAKLEFYRRVAVPYEQQKCHDNGDVYDGII